MQRLFVWRVGLQNFAMPFPAVLKVVRAVALTEVPVGAPFVCGVINMHGAIVPVIDVRRRFKLPQRTLVPADHFIIVRTPQRTLALWVDAAHGVVECPDELMIQEEATIPGTGSPAGFCRLPDGLVLLHDLEQCLSAGDGLPAELGQ